MPGSRSCAASYLQYRPPDSKKFYLLQGLCLRNKAQSRAEHRSLPEFITPSTVKSSGKEEAAVTAPTAMAG